MTIRVKELLEKSVRKLSDAGISTARLDVLVLLEDLTRKERGWLLAHLDYSPDLSQIADFDSQVERRAKHEPLAYIRGRSEFYGREFLVNAHTLEPRPETETMIELVKTLVKSREKFVIADVGTGSGCIAISVKLELPDAAVLATDIDVKCVKTARENSEKLGAEVTYFQGNLMEPITQKIDMVLSNLPYVPDKYELNKAAKFEPKHAIFGGPDGLDLYRELFKQLGYQVQKPKLILTESLPFQHEELTKIAENQDYRLEKTDDFIQVFTS